MYLLDYVSGTHEHILNQEETLVTVNKLYLDGHKPYILVKSTQVQHKEKLYFLHYRL
jgi:hypothetical protein